MIELTAAHYRVVQMFVAAMSDTSLHSRMYAQKRHANSFEYRLPVTICGRDFEVHWHSDVMGILQGFPEPEVRVVAPDWRMTVRYFKSVDELGPEITSVFPYQPHAPKIVDISGDMVAFERDMVMLRVSDFRPDTPEERPYA